MGPHHAVHKLMMPPVHHMTQNKEQMKHMQKKYLDQLQKHLDNAQNSLNVAKKAVEQGKDLHQIH